MAKIVQQTLEAEGVSFHINTSIVSTRDLGTEREVTVETAAGKLSDLRASSARCPWTFSKHLGHGAGKHRY